MHSTDSVDLALYGDPGACIPVLSHISHWLLRCVTSLLPTPSCTLSLSAFLGLGAQDTPVSTTCLHFQDLAPQPLP